MPPTCSPMRGSADNNSQTRTKTAGLSLLEPWHMSREDVQAVVSCSSGWRELFSIADIMMHPYMVFTNPILSGQPACKAQSHRGDDQPRWTQPGGSPTCGKGFQVSDCRPESDALLLLFFVCASAVLSLCLVSLYLCPSLLFMRVWRLEVATPMKSIPPWQEVIFSTSPYMDYRPAVDNREF